jgi:hypothetical protein
MKRCCCIWAAGSTKHKQKQKQKHSSHNDAQQQACYRRRRRHRHRLSPTTQWHQHPRSQAEPHPCYSLLQTRNHKIDPGDGIGVGEEHPGLFAHSHHVHCPEHDEARQGLSHDVSSEHRGVVMTNRESEAKEGSLTTLKRVTRSRTAAGLGAGTAGTAGAPAGPAATRSGAWGSFCVHSLVSQTKKKKRRRRPAIGNGGPVPR